MEPQNHRRLFWLGIGSFLILMGLLSTLYSLNNENRGMGDILLSSVGHVYGGSSRDKQNLGDKNSHNKNQEKTDTNLPTLPTQPLLSPSELTLFTHYLTQAQSILEWGMGGSTLLACTHPSVRFRSFVSFESDTGWFRAVCAGQVYRECGRMRKTEGEDNGGGDGKGTDGVHTTDITNRLPPRVMAFHVPLGPVRAFGHPQSNQYQSIWPLYSLSVHLFMGGGLGMAMGGGVGMGEGMMESDTQNDYYNVPVDMVWVDGRFRVACVLETVLAVHLLNHNGGSSIDEGNVGTNTNISDPYILIHDYTNRPQYHIVQPYLLPIKTVDTLTVWKVRPLENDATSALNALMQLIQEARYQTN